MKLSFREIPYKYLKLALIMLLLAGAVEWLSERQKDKKGYLQKVQENIENVSSIAQSGIYNLKHQIKQNNNIISFANLLPSQSSEIPVSYYIFDNKKNLVFWSDNKLDLSAQDFKGFNFVDRCIQKGSSVFYVRKSNIVIYNQDYTVVSVIPIFIDHQVESFYLSQGALPYVFPSVENLSIKVDRSFEEGDKVVNRNGSYLFTLVVDFEGQYINEMRWSIFALLSLAFIFFSMEVFLVVRLLVQKDRGWTAASLLFVFLLLNRVIMEVFDVPYNILPYDFFAQKDFSYTTLSSTELGVILNFLSYAIWLSFIFNHFDKLVPIRKLLTLSNRKKQVLGVLLTLLTFLVSTYIEEVLKAFFGSISTSLSLYNSFQNIPAYLLGICLFVIASAIYFWVCHIASKLLIKLLPSSMLVAIMGGTALLYFSVIVLYGAMDIMVFNINALYVAVITLLGLPKRISFHYYKAFFYIVSSAMACALIGTYSSYKYGTKQSVKDMREFAGGLLNNEEEIESYLEEVLIELKEDTALVNTLKRQSYDTWGKDKVLHKLYLNRYFERYDIAVSLFDALQNPITGTRTLKQEVKPYIPHAEKISDFVVALNDPNTGTKSYLCTVPISDDKQLAGYVSLKVKAKRFSYSNAHHFFLKNGQLRAWQNDYSYANYFNGELVYSFGNFPYSNAFLDEFSYDEMPHLMRREIEVDGVSHLRIPNGIDKNIIVSVNNVPFGNLFGNFSFLFLLLVFTLLSGLSVFNLLTKPRDYELNFSTKIQIYLNIAFFIPLTVVGVVVVTVMSSLNGRELKETYIDKAQGVTTYLFNDVIQYNKGSLSVDKLADKIYDLSGVIQSDIHFYNASGKLMASSDDYLFDVGLLSRNVNPHAYAGISENKLDKVMLSESVGRLKYNTVYVSLKSLASGELLGYLSIPFFRSGYRLDKQVVEVLVTVMKVFSIVLILLLPLSFLTSQSLLKPLNMIRAKLGKITFSAENEPLEYHARDEFGLLIGEYNRMLMNLEESKVALAQSEKESAWREMAKQVAHEIKNPLTPMRLTLQQLQRVLNTSEDKRVAKALNMMLVQVDTLADIATSFSAFAKMPLPKSERFDIAKSLHDIVLLHQSKQDADIEEHVPKGEYFVKGDQKLMGRIFTNLLLNGVQSVKDGKRPVIHINLRTNEVNKVVIEFKDNGEGIPEQIQGKVFTPNFTTKSTGSGIGLALSKRGVEHSGGSIWFETEEGKGTSFFVEMPLDN